MAKRGAETRSSVRSTDPTASAKGAGAGLTVSLPQFINRGSDLEFREFVAALFAAVAGMQSLRRALASSVGLSAAEYSVVLATWHLQNKGAVGITTIAKQLHVASANVTADVGQLVNKGLLKKKPHPHDTRAVLVELTDSGKEILAQLTPLLRKINDRLFSDNKQSELPILSRFVQHLADETVHSIRMARAFASEHPEKKKTRNSSTRS